MPKKIWFAAALGWTVFVTVLCLVSFSDLPSVNVSGVDKYVHATFHFVFVVLWFNYLRVEGRQNKTVLHAVILSLAYGILIEIAQGLFTATRQADPKDVAANTAGAIIAAILLFSYNTYTKAGARN
ncbi:VanZ family protein [Flavobacterium sp.]|uniref:VanZ family protein n=1 Tax=Flavobacterium sp. TaxID=239 RepID=UPI0025C08480|nr:VanZ family protein [Flavobacterium sp.]